MAHNCIVVNLDRCTGCYSCEITCKMENDIALGEHWNKMLQRGPFGDYPNMTRYPLPTMCQQCADAPCVHVCPTGASYRDGNNVVLIDREKCIGCKYCMMACPYGVRDWNKASKTVEKCTLCGHLTANGELPACSFMLKYSGNPAVVAVVDAVVVSASGWLSRQNDPVTSGEGVPARAGRRE